MRTTTGTTKIECSGCPEVVVIDRNALPPSGWGRGTHEEYIEGGKIQATPYDTCPRCNATLPWRRP